MSTPPDLRQYVNADQFVQHAGLPISGRTLQRDCDRNPFLVERLGEIRWRRKRLYDSRTAPEFRRHLMEAEREMLREEARIHAQANRREGSDAEGA